MEVEIVSPNNTFIKYLCSFIWFNQERLMAMMKRYFIGATKQGEPIFWHINAEHKITNGHIITMDDDTGRVYDESWYYQDGRLMCLFGEHLLKDFPDKTVALVKDEMTAAIMSCFPTPYIWLATGKEMITSTDLLPLEGKDVVVFPEKGEYGRWQESVKAVTNMQFHVSDVMERVEGDFYNIAQVVLSQQPLCPTEEEVALMRLEDTNPNVTKLIEALDLEMVSVSNESMTSKSAIQKSETASGLSVQPKADDASQKIKLAQEKRWHGRNVECHKCSLSHEGISGTYCGMLKRYVEYGKGDCGR